MNLELKNFTFTYALGDSPALDNISAGIQRGDFCVIAGRSGSGKTTLLKCFKPSVAPAGKKSGEILFDGADIGSLSKRDAAEKIGYVAQRPDEQLVCDTVRHELAFGMLNLGYGMEEAKLRSAEVCEFFGISDLYRKKTAELSGGEKQLVNLAAVMTFSPSVLLLDEPEAQLDPVSKNRLFDVLARLNLETGVTVVIACHRLEGLLNLATKIIYLENGRAVFCGGPRRAVKTLDDDNFIKSLPAPARLGRDMPEEKIPLTVRDARRLGLSFSSQAGTTPCGRPPDGDPLTGDRTGSPPPAALEVRRVYYRYGRKADYILNGVTAAFPKGKITAVTGGNGAGKSTLLKVLAGILKPQSGKVKHPAFEAQNATRKTQHAIGYLPQDPLPLFTEKTVGAELSKLPGGAEYSYIADGLLDRNPFDLSGGELQRAALAFVMSAGPDILLADEPVKGADSLFREELGDLLRQLCREGKTVIAVSHDLDFCRLCADQCAFLFDGEIVAFAPADKFFEDRLYYTTEEARLTE
ncbi:MAG: ATP-binding cassette domain-containing protein [Clostridia bacterium]|nr:ATP-binding cassette domain-containing protein [Clostridia bacterium]